MVVVTMQVDSCSFDQIIVKFVKLVDSVSNSYLGFRMLEADSFAFDWEPPLVFTEEAKQAIMEGNASPVELFGEFMAYSIGPFFPFNFADPSYSFVVHPYLAP